MTSETPTDPARTPWHAQMLRPEWIALFVAVIALGFSLASYTVGFDARVRNYLLSNPTILQEMVTRAQAAEQASDSAAIQANLDNDPALLRIDPRDPAFGPADARVTVVEYFDYRCPGCKAIAEPMLALIEANPDVRFVFREWPILDRGDDVTSHTAAYAALAAHQQGRYLQVHRALMEARALDQESITRILEDNGVDIERAVAFIESAGVRDHVADVGAVAQGKGLIGTPSFIVNGRYVEDFRPESLQAAIDAARASTR